MLRFVPSVPSQLSISIITILFPFSFHPHLPYHTHAHTYNHSHPSTNSHIHIHLHTHIYLYTYTHTPIYLHTNMHPLTPIHTHPCTHSLISIHLHPHNHWHPCTPTHSLTSILIPHLTIHTSIYALTPHPSTHIHVHAHTYPFTVLNPKGNQLQTFIGRTDAKAEAPILWSPDTKSWLVGKDPDAGKVRRQKGKEAAEDEMVGWYQQLNGHKFEPAVGDSKDQGSLACCSPWDCKESDMT